MSDGSSYLTIWLGSDDYGRQERQWGHVVGERPVRQIIRTCESGGFVERQPQKIDEFNERRYGSWMAGPGDRERIDEILHLVAGGERVLDVGCGTGVLGRLLIAAGKEVRGLDASKGAVRMAREEGIEAVQCDVERDEWPVPRESVDVVVAGEILEHIFDTDRFLEKVRVCLIPSRALIISTPNLVALGRRLLMLLGYAPHMEYAIREHDAGHIRYFIKGTLLRLLEENGFRVEKVTSDVVNFNASGSIRSAGLARLIPTWGRTLIVKASRT